MEEKELKEYIKRVPKQKYIFSEEDECPFCGEKNWDGAVYISCPPQLRCSSCDRFVTVY